VPALESERLTHSTVESLKSPLRSSLFTSVVLARFLRRSVFYTHSSSTHSFGNALLSLPFLYTPSANDYCTHVTSTIQFETDHFSNISSLGPGLILKLADCRHQRNHGRRRTERKVPAVPLRPVFSSSRHLRNPLPHHNSRSHMADVQAQNVVLRSLHLRWIV
jgi:hypothetical protein